MMGTIKNVSLELEEVVLGALMLDNAAIYKVDAIIKPMHMGTAKHQLIYEAISNLYSRNMPIDLLTTSEELIKMGALDKIGGPYALVEISNKVASAANVEAHSVNILEYWMRREASKLGAEIQKEASDNTTDTFNLLDAAELKLEKIKEATNSASQQSNQSIADKLMIKMDKAADGGQIGRDLFGIPSLDSFMEGAADEDLIIVAGRPAMGKSSLINSSIKHHILNNIPALYWSCELSNTNTMARALSACTDIPYSRILRKEFFDDEEDNFYYWLDKVIASPVFFEDRAGINVMDFKSKVITLQRKHGIQAAFIDRIGLLDDIGRVANDNKSSRVGENTKIMRQMAINLGMPIVALNQLNRAVESRPLKIPMLSDLRESGNIEQDATKVILLYRPEYYKIMEDENGESTRDKAYFILAKNTNGKTGSVKSCFKGECMYFHDEAPVFNGQTW